MTRRTARRLKRRKSEAVGTLTIRNLDDRLKQALRERAARRGVSMEQEMREVITKGTARPRRRESILEELRLLGAKPSEPFDQKKISDEMWDESVR
jgi:antitoxin FitA